jgi:hypothetical protein
MDTVNLPRFEIFVFFAVSLGYKPLRSYQTDNL